MKNDSDKWRQNFERHWLEKFGEPYVPKEMTEDEKKALEEAEKKVFDYDPSDEELDKLYGKVDLQSDCFSDIIEKYNRGEFVISFYQADRKIKMAEPKNPTKPVYNKKGNVKDSVTSQFLNFLSDLKIALMSEEGSMVLIDNIGEAIDVLRGNNKPEEKVIDDAPAEMTEEKEEETKEVLVEDYPRSHPTIQKLNTCI